MHLSKTNGWVAVILMITAFAWSKNVSAQQSQQKRVAPIITAQQIRQLQTNETKRNQFVVVDVRSVAETEVSIIPGAITKAQFESDHEKHQQKAVIVYCTSGARSAKYANQLKQKGWNAWNYKGSILDWCKNKLPLTKVDGKTTNRVHTYSARNRVPRRYKAVH